jgi:hypothetical protein
MCWPVLASIKLVRSLRVEAFVIRLIDRSGSGTRRLSATLLIALCASEDGEEIPKREYG